MACRGGAELTEVRVGRQKLFSVGAPLGPYLTADYMSLEELRVDDLGVVCHLPNNREGQPLNLTQQAMLAPPPHYTVGQLLNYQYDFRVLTQFGS